MPQPASAIESNKEDKASVTIISLLEQTRFQSSNDWLSTHYFSLQPSLVFRYCRNSTILSFNNPASWEIYFPAPPSRRRSSWIANAYSLKLFLPLSFTQCK